MRLLHFQVRELRSWLCVWLFGLSYIILRQAAIILPPAGSDHSSYWFGPVGYHLSEGPFFKTIYRILSSF